MPLSDHEQRMLDQIEVLSTPEDPKFASSVRGGVCEPRRRADVCRRGLFVLGLAMLVAGVAIKATMIGGFPALSVVGFVVMFAGVIFAVTGPPVVGSATAARRRGRPVSVANAGGGGPSPVVWRIVSVVVSTSNSRQRVSGAAQTAARFISDGSPCPPSTRCAHPGDEWLRPPTSPTPIELCFSPSATPDVVGLFRGLSDAEGLMGGAEWRLWVNEWKKWGIVGYRGGSGVKSPSV